MKSFKGEILSVKVNVGHGHSLTKGYRLKHQHWNSLQWPISAINSVDNTKLLSLKNEI